MNQLEALTALRDKVKAGEANPYEIFNAFDTPCQDMALQQRAEDAKNAYNGSLDAAKAMHEAVLPGWRYFGGLSVVSDGYLYTVYHPEFYDCEAASNMDPARAWLLAILEALIAQEQDT